MTRLADQHLGFNPDLALVVTRSFDGDGRRKVTNKTTHDWVVGQAFDWKAAQIKQENVESLWKTGYVRYVGPQETPPPNARNNHKRRPRAGR